MTEIKHIMSIKTLANLMGTSIEGLGEMTGIKGQHLKDVSSGRVTMTARDLIQLSKVTQIPCEQIQIDY